MTSKFYVRTPKEEREDGALEKNEIDPNLDSLLLDTNMEGAQDRLYEVLDVDCARHAVAREIIPYVDLEEGSDRLRELINKYADAQVRFFPGTGHESAMESKGERRLNGNNSVMVDAMVLVNKGDGLFDAIEFRYQKSHACRSHYVKPPKSSYRLIDSLKGNN